MARIHSTQKDFMSSLVTRVLSYPSLQRERGCFMRSDQLAKLKKNCKSAIWNFQWFEAICPINGFFFTFDKRKCELPYYILGRGKKAWDRALSLLSPCRRLVVRWLFIDNHTNIDRDSGWRVDWFNLLSSERNASGGGLIIITVCNCLNSCLGFCKGGASAQTLDSTKTREAYIYSYYLGLDDQELWWTGKGSAKYIFR